jgi:hypothetical protein
MCAASKPRAAQPPATAGRHDSLLEPSPDQVLLPFQRMSVAGITRMTLPPVEPLAPRAALASVVPRLSALIRSIAVPGAPAVGDWNAADVAVHLTHVWDVLPALAAGSLESPLQRPEDLAGLTAALVSGEPSRDLQAAADHIEAAASTYLATPAGDNAPRPWLVAGTALPPSAFACHLLNESLIHGFDIARSQRRRWPIAPAHAGLAIMGFALQALSVVDPRFAVDQRYAAGVRACFDVQVRGAGRFYLVLDDGALSIEPPSARRVDCHISASPVALFLLFWSRTRQWRELLSGGVLAWGRRPSLGLRLPRMLRNP